MQTIIIRGESLSGGIAVGRVCLYEENVLEALPKYSLRQEDEEREKQRLRKGIKSTRDELRLVREKVSRALGETEAEVFQAHISILEDASFIRSIENIISRRMVNAEWAVSAAIGEYEQKLKALPDDYFRERAGDLEDIARRIIKNLGYEHTGFACTGCEPSSSVVAARNLTPSLISGLGDRRPAGIIAEKGSATAHGAILARALGIPVVIRMDNLIDNLGCGTPVIVDAEKGAVFIAPDSATYDQYKPLLDKRAARARPLKGGVATTRDGVNIKIMANASSVSDITAARELGVDEVGLFRTEFLFAGRQDRPPAAEQEQAYRKIMNLTPGTVAFRLLDAGGDKHFNFIPLPEQENPNLGLRGARIYHRYPEILDEQIEALLAAGDGRPFRITVPMVAVIDEFLEIREKILKKAEKMRVSAESVGIGCMIEIPAAVIKLEHFTRECDFLSIGTNDLIQYIMAADRENDYLEKLKNPVQPAVIEVLGHIAETCSRAGKEAAVCGEMAGEPETALLLARLGFRHLSISPGRIAAAAGALSSEYAAGMGYGAEKGSGHK